MDSLRSKGESIDFGSSLKPGEEFKLPREIIEKRKRSLGKGHLGNKSQKGSKW